MPAMPAQPYADVVGGRRDGPGHQPDHPGVEPRVAMDAEDAVDTGQSAGSDHVERAARHDLLGRLEDQPHPAGQQALPVQVGEHQTGAEHDRGVNVVRRRGRPR